MAGGGRRHNAALARPESDGKHPGVVVIHEVLGDQPEMRGVWEEFARHGYVAVLPDLFSRSRAPSDLRRANDDRA